MDNSQLLNKIEKNLYSLNDYLENILDKKFFGIKNLEDALLQLYKKNNDIADEIFKIKYREFNYLKIKILIEEGRIKDALEVAEDELDWSLKKNYKIYYIKILNEYLKISSDKTIKYLYQIPKVLIDKNKKELNLILNHLKKEIFLSENIISKIKNIKQFIEKSQNGIEEKITIGVLSKIQSKIEMNILEAIIYSYGTEFENIFKDKKNHKKNNLTISDEEILKLELSSFRKNEEKKHTKNFQKKSTKNVTLNEWSYKEIYNSNEGEFDYKLAKLKSEKKYTDILIIIDECEPEIRSKYRELIWECIQRINEKN